MCDFVDHRHCKIRHNKRLLQVIIKFKLSNIQSHNEYIRYWKSDSFCPLEFILKLRKSFRLNPKSYFMCDVVDSERCSCGDTVPNTCSELHFCLSSKIRSSVPRHWSSFVETIDDDRSYWMNKNIDSEWEILSKICKASFRDTRCRQRRKSHKFSMKVKFRSMFVEFRFRWRHDYYWWWDFKKKEDLILQILWINRVIHNGFLTNR